MRVQIAQGITVILLMGQLAIAAEFHGHNIDGQPFNATLVELNKYRYKGTVTFKGKAAVLHVRKAITVSVDQPKSKEVRLLLCSEEINNPYHIEVTTPGLKCSTSRPHPIILELQIPDLDTTQWPK